MSDSINCHKYLNRKEGCKRRGPEAESEDRADPSKKESPKALAIPDLEKHSKKKTVCVRMGATNESWDYLAKIQFSAGQI